MVTTQKTLQPQTYNNTKQSTEFSSWQHEAQFTSPSTSDTVTPSSGRSPSSYQTLSPKASMTSLNEFESGNSSGQDEFHLERYSEHGKSHQRTDSDLKRSRKPDLNIITSFQGPTMPMKTEEVKLSEVQSKNPRNDISRTRSVVSQKAVQAVATPKEPRQNKIAFVTLADLVATSKHKNKGKKLKGQDTKDQCGADVKRSALNQDRIPIGIMVPSTEADAVKANAGPDSAYPIGTPTTPAIVITPAEPEPKPMIHLGVPSNTKRAPVSSVYSAAATNPFKTPKLQNDTPPLLQGNTSLPRSNETNPFYRKKQRNPDIAQHLENSYEQDVSNCRENTNRQSMDDMLPSATSNRPQSQGWWNLMLSPMLRAGSFKSRKGQPNTPVETVPPLPTTTKQEQLSPKSQGGDLSPETPRRRGLANVREITWSRWTEWEGEREVNDAKQRNAHAFEQGLKALDQPECEDIIKFDEHSRPKEGLAAEYYHAAAVEQLSGCPYFECQNHSCAESWPQFKSIYDFDRTKRPVLASPFNEFQASDEVNTTGMVKEVITSPNQDEKILHMLSPNELSPNVREANTGAVMKARALDFSKIDEVKEVQIATNSSEKDPVPVYPSSRQVVDVSDEKTVAKFRRGFIPEKLDINDTAVQSPGPFSPAGEKALAPSDGVPMSTVNPVPRSGLPAQPKTVFVANHVGYPNLPERPAFVTSQTSYPDAPQRAPVAAITIDDIETREIKTEIEARRQRHEKEDKIARKAGGLWRGRGCVPKNGCFGRGGREGRTKRRWIIGIGLALLAIIIVSVVLAITLTRGDGTPVQSQWLNLSGFPPMPTGISTIAAPNLVYSQNQCVNPTTMWSCSVPPEVQAEIAPNSPSQPNFRFEIRFQNGTVASNLTIPITDDKGKPRTKRDINIFADDQFTPVPTPPNDADQNFLGQTTDNITQPYDGEQTPFFMSFMSVFPVIPSALNIGTSKLKARQDDSNSSSSSSSATLDAIPPPSLLSNNTPTPANMLPTNPYPQNQPVKLYNRNLPDEHYGFYIYYDKTIFLSSMTISDNNLTLSSDTSQDQNGGCPQTSAIAVCTFSQTRYLVKLFTNPSFLTSNPLLASPSGTTDPNTSNTARTNATNSATDFTRPGSFPYPASITLDRHGGDINKKAAFCWAIGADGTVNVNDPGSKLAFAELRDVGGNGPLINPANQFGSSGFNASAGGIDGGTGGCGCQWQNF